MSVELPSHLGVLPVAKTCLLPGGLLPLHVVTQHDCKVLEKTLSGEFDLRKCNYNFGNKLVVVMIRSQIPNLHPTLFNVGCAAVIRSCLRDVDGSGTLIVEGLQRVRLSDFTREPGFSICRITRLDGFASSLDELQELGLEILDLYEKLKIQGVELPKNFDRYLSLVQDVERFSDIIVSVLIPDPLIRQKLLEQQNIAARMRHIIECLRNLLS